MSFNNTASTNEAVKTAHGVSSANFMANASTLPNVDSLSDAVIYSFFASQSNSSQLDNKDLKKIDLDDLEEIDLKWQMEMLTRRARRFLKKTRRNLGVNGTDTIGFDKTKVECYNCHRRGHFARECRAPKYQDNRNRETKKRTVPVEETTSKALVSQCDGFGYDWSDQAEEGPTNFTLMIYTSSGSSSSSSSHSKVSTCSKACLKSYETLKEHYDNLTKDFNKSQLNVGAYKAGLESVEARLEVYKKNEEVFEEDIKILKLDVILRDNALTELRKKFEKAEKERDDLKLTLEKFETSSKNLSKLLEIQVSDKFKTGVGFDSQVLDSQVNDKYKTSEGYHAVPPPYTGNFIPLNLICESKPKSVSEPLIEDWISDSEDENQTKSMSKQRKPSFAKVEFVKSNEHVKSPRESTEKGNPQLELQEKGVIDSGCSRHMTGNKSYLSDYEEIDGGFVAFGGDPKGGRITGKGKISTDTECVVLSPDFMLLDENHVLLRVPRKDNMHNVDLRNIVPSRGLTCLFAKKPCLKLHETIWGPVTILNTIDHLGKFDGKTDEGFFVGYSTNSKAFRVFNSRTRIVEENLHVQFSEDTPNIARSGPNWLFNIDALIPIVEFVRTP
ncbi:putative ribonuclease H-like domain-containing protein [Tanacetum coccineum]